ncbi:MAG: DNA polymerase III subunit delta [Acidimicrobiales bacterium]|nr:DNA polymerase III subunit delta [Acidimicrobiales bacterium]
MKSKPIYLLNGDDPSLLSESLTKLVNELVGDGDRTLLVDELAGEEYTVEHVVDAAHTIAFLSDRRIVVARGFERFSADELDPMVRYLGDPLDTSTVVVEWRSGRIPKRLTDAIKSAGGEKRSTAAPAQARARQGWLDERMASSPVALEPRAKKLIADHLGEDVGRLGGLLATLESAFGPGVKLGVDDVAPFLGDAGSVPVWDLTDAVDRGDIGGSLGVLARMLDAGGMHPLQVMAVLHRHFERMLMLDGSGVRDDKAAAALLGMKGSTFPAKKALTQTRRLGSEPIRSAIGLLARADLDLKGNSALEARTVVEILTARLAQLAARR